MKIFVVLLMVIATSLLDAAELKYTRVEGAGGVPLNVVTAGDPAKPAIVLIHGIGQSYLSWERQLESPLAENFHLIAFDLRGHGNSGKPWAPEAYTDSRLWAEDVQRVIAATKAQRPLLVGWSYGTLVVGDYVRRFGTDDVAGIALTGAYGGFTARPTTNAANAAVLERMQRNRKLQASGNIEDNLAAADAVARQLTAKPMPEEWIDRAARISLMLPGYARAWMFERPIDNRDVAGRIAKPVLLFVGSKDGSTPEAGGRELAASLPDAAVSVFADAGHSPFAEDPERFNRELAAFATRVFAR